MARKITLSGGSAETDLLLRLDGGGELKVSTETAMKASDLYKFLDYRRGNTYEVETGERGRVRKEVYDMFLGLLRDVATKLNSIDVPDAYEDDEASGASDDEAKPEE